MHARPAAALVCLLLLAISTAAWGQVQEPPGADPFAQTGADGSIQAELFSMDDIPGGGVTVALFIYFLVAFSLFQIASAWILFAKADLESRNKQAYYDTKD